MPARRYSCYDARLMTRKTRVRIQVAEVSRALHCAVPCNHVDVWACGTPLVTNIIILTFNRKINNENETACKETQPTLRSVRRPQIFFFFRRAETA